ncbi:MAG: hypothetical protein ACYDHG_13605, partial [Desulfomonilaceae bacterium]
LLLNTFPFGPLVRSNIHEPMAVPWVALGIIFAALSSPMAMGIFGSLAFIVFPTVEPWAHECCPCRGKYDYS